MWSSLGEIAQVREGHGIIIDSLALSSVVCIEAGLCCAIDAEDGLDFGRT